MNTYLVSRRKSFSLDIFNKGLLALEILYRVSINKITNFTSKIDIVDSWGSESLFLRKIKTRLLAVKT